MTLTSALRIAQSSLFNVSLQTNLASRNIGDAGNEDYVRRQANVITTDYGARTYSISRADKPLLFRDSIAALSDSSAQSAVADIASRLQTLVNGVDNLNAPATRIDTLREALQLYSSDPSSDINARTVIEAARDLGRSLSASSNQIQSLRADIDRQLIAGVNDLNGLLTEFEAVNRQIVSGTQIGADVNEQLDRRDGLLKRISEHVSVSIVQRENNDYALYTDQGMTLFETVPRAITFEPMVAHTPGVPGGALRIDGVPVRGGQGANTTASGSLAALIQARDGMAGQMQAQLDEMARGLIEAFGGAAPGAGLFTHSHPVALPAVGTVANGLALTLQVNPALDPDQGGDPSLLRDGGGYAVNASGGAGFTDNILGLIAALDTPRPVDPVSGISGDRSVATFAQTSIGWVEDLRASASLASEAKFALHEKLSGDYLGRTGVSIDDEMTKLIALEQSYEASARVISVVDQLFDTLLSVAR